jgi:excisionase family DNA binding protein
VIKQDLTTEDVARALSLNKVTVQRLLKRGSLKGYQIGRSWRIPQESLEEFRANGLRTIYAAKTDKSLANVVKEEKAEWLRRFHDETYLVDAPTIPTEALRRENIYEDRH